MTSPEGSKGSSPLRVGGLALIGAAVIAGAFGVVGLTSGGPPTPVAAPSLTTPAAPAPTVEAAAPSAAPAPVPPPASPAPAAPPAPAPPPTPPPAAAAPPAAAPPASVPPAAAPPAAAPPAPAPRAAAPPAAAPPAGGGARSGGSATAARSPLRVYNNSAIGGLAAGAAEDFRQAGWTVDEVANYSSSSDGIIPTSTVYYRPGTGEEGSAERIGSEFGLRAAPRFAGLQDASPGLIVIVTKDYQKR